MTDRCLPEGPTVRDFSLQLNFFQNMSVACTDFLKVTGSHNSFHNSFSATFSPPEEPRCRFGLHFGRSHLTMEQVFRICQVKQVCLRCKVEKKV